MFKIIIVLLVVIGIVTTVRPVRDRVMPPIVRALGPTGEKIATPVRRWKAEHQAERLLSEMQIELTAGRQPPPAHEFSQWAKKELREPDADIDPWGGKYYLKPGRGMTISVGSPGPDLKKGTEDDIIVQKTLER
jgi:hypothetical protein